MTQVNADGWTQAVCNHHGTLPSSPPSSGCPTDDANPIADFVYTFNLDGQKLTETRNGAPSTTSYSYDNAGRLVTASFPDGSARRYCYDADSNRTQLQETTSGSPPVCGTANPAQTYTYDPSTTPGLDQLTSTTINGQTTGYSYTADGQVASRAADTFSWDGWGRQSGDSVNGVAGVQFQVDGQNQGSEITGSPYSTTWNTSGVTAGSHTITAIARDRGGNQTVSAAVPVTVGGGTPTLLVGHNDGGSQSVTIGVGTAEASSAVATTSGTLSRLWILVAGSGSTVTKGGAALLTTTKINVGIYANASGKPGALLAQGQITNPTTGAWNSVTVSSVTITAGTTYWLAANVPYGSPALSWGGGSTQTTSYSAGIHMTTLPATWTQSTLTHNTDGPFQIYGDGGSSGGGGGGPAITLTPSAMSFSTNWATNPASRTLSITNTGSGTINWTAASSASWLTVSPTSGTAPSTPSVSVATLGLPVGTYRGQITVAASGAANSPSTLNVVLTIPPAGDTTAPTVTITSPTSGGNVSGTVALTATASDDSTSTLSYAYDPLGELRQRIDAGRTTRYLYAGAAVPIFETDAAGTVTASYQGGPVGDLSRFAGVPATGSTVSYLYYDGHGDLAGEADSTGTRTAAYSYDPFGATQETASANSTTHRYTGRWDKQLDTANGLILMGARPYDPSLGRFLSVDPVQGGSLNDYDYAGQDPVSRYDLDGTCNKAAWYGFTCSAVAAASSGAKVTATFAKGAFTSWKGAILFYAGTEEILVGAGMTISGVLVAGVCIGETGGVGFAPCTLAGATMAGTGIVLVYSGVSDYYAVYRLGKKPHSG